jgi:hypothetical protein
MTFPLQLPSAETHTGPDTVLVLIIWVSSSKLTILRFAFTLPCYILLGIAIQVIQGPNANRWYGR